MVSSIGTLGSIDAYTSPLLQFHNDRLTKLQEQQTVLSSRLSLYSTLSSRFNDFESALKAITGSGVFSNGAGNVLQLSTDQYFSATGTQDAVEGNYTVFVNRIASQDTFLSREAAKTGTDLQQALDKKESFFITTGSGKSNKISVDINSGDNNLEILQKFADEINAVSTGEVLAEVVNTSPTTARLSIKSAGTGASQAITFSNAKGEALFAGGLDLVQTDYSRKKTTGAGGGAFITDTESLNAELKVNGIQIVRETNTIDDALTGISLELKGAQSAGAEPVTINVKSASTQAREDIDNFITAYNAFAAYMNSVSGVNQQTLERGELASESTFRNLRLDLRGMVSGSVTQVNSTDPRTLRDLGISMNQDGTLSVTDSEKLTAVLKDNLEGAGRVLAGQDSFGARLLDRIDDFTGTSGIIRGRERQTNNRLRSMTQRISRVERDINMQQELFKRQYSRLQRTMSILQSQQSTISGMFGSRSSMFNLFLGL